VRDILPPGAANEADTAALVSEVLAYKPVVQSFKKQKKSGMEFQLTSMKYQMKRYFFNQ